MEAQLHLVAFVLGDGMLTIVVVPIATSVGKITVLRIQMVRQRAAELVAIFGPDTTTAWYENTPYVGRQDFVAVT
jgi:hypothetical protein